MAGVGMLTKVDVHGVVEYKTGFKVAVVLLAIATTVIGGGYLMFLIEHGAPGANVHSWRDGTWVVTMTMTTVGYGDFYPVTDWGRSLGWCVFILGAVELGFLIGIVSSAMGSDKTIQNRELRSMLCEVMRKLEHMEKHMNMPTDVNERSNHLDVVFKQERYSSKKLRDGFLTIGKDSTGIYMMSVDAYDRETNQEVHRWIPESSRESLNLMFKRYLRNENEL